MTGVRPVGRPALLGGVAVAAAALLAIVIALADDDDVATERSATTTSSAPATTAPTTSTTTTSSTTPTTTAPVETTTTRPVTTVPRLPAVGGPAGRTLLVWTSGGLPPGFADDVAAIPQVAAHTVVLGDLVRLLETQDGAGAVVDRAPDGWAFPIDAFAIDPATYAAFQTGDDAATLAALQPGQAVLTRSSALLRRLDAGGVLRLAGGAVTVSGVVADESGGGAEVVVHRDDAGRLGIDDERFLLVADTDRAAALDAIRARTPAGEFLSLRSSAEARWLRHGDRVEPQARVKRAFGEFAFRDAGGRDIRIEEAWTAQNIVTTTVPLLGEITCHRAVVSAVRDAMAALEAAGRGDTVRPQNYAGCQYPRRIAPGSGLSRHTWGIALDLNIASDPRGTFESQDPALVQAMTSRGFSWGGEWEYPDPGHYEFVARPDG